MPLTPDDALELLFAPSIIPQSIRDLLPSELHIRPLSSTDHARGHLSVLSVLSPAPDPGPAAYQERFRACKALADTYYTLVIVDRASDAVVATGTLFLERKFTRGLGLVGHIEDIAVDKSQQGKKLGLRVIQALTALSEARGAYKTILNCSKDNIVFYEKCGFALKECEMAKYAKDTQVVQKL
ncbi:acyl-CoA N-acyltransferase [Auricularia subglabra TFB-10046 SS5]|nr:acyl-CoA N-acyltransferase [Auricularia subglabra TFB-10046 SS5]